MIATIHAFFASIVTYLHHNPNMGSLLAFLVSFTESLPLIGTIIPGSVTMTAMGALIGAGVLPFGATFFWSVLGAFLGDFTGYGIGYYFQDGLQKIWPFRRYPQWIEKGEKFFQAHGGKSIILGRFIGPARSAVPMIAGLLRLHWLRFAAAAIPSAILWAMLYILPGILLGALSLEIPAAKTTEFMIGGLLIILALWAVVWSIQHFFRQLASFTNRKVDQLWNWLSTHHRSKWFISLITNKGNPKDHYQLTLSLSAILFLILFFVIFFEVVSKGFLTHLNNPIFHVLQSFRNPHADNFFVIFTCAFEPKLTIISGLFLAFLLAVARQWRPSLHLFLLTLSIACIVVGFKDFIYFSPRPEGFLLIKSGSSFPSGHVALAVSVLGFVAYLITQRAGDISRYAAYSILSILVILIAFSRLYLGCHWLTDIIGSIFLGLAFLLAAIVSYRRHQLNITLKRLSAWKFSGMIIIAFLPIWILGNVTSFKKVKIETTPYFSIQTVSLQTWWSNPTHYLPLYRDNRFGVARQPFNLQWVGDIQKIQAYLESQGWSVNHSKITLKSTLQRFASKDPQYHLSLLPALYHHEKPKLTMIKYLPSHEGIFVLRLWQPAVTLTDAGKTLWIGSIYLQFPPPKLLSFHHENLQSFLVKDNLIKLLGNLGQRKTKINIISLEDQPQKIKELNWNGEILIIQD
jgi:membrane protein DedA with SNARE-associated domain